MEKIGESHEFRLTKSEFMDMRLKALQFHLAEHRPKDAMRADEARDFVVNAMLSGQPIEYFYNENSHQIRVQVADDFVNFTACP